MGLNLLFLGVLLLPWASALLVALFPKPLFSISLSAVFSLSVVAFLLNSTVNFKIAFTWFQLGGQEVNASFWANTPAQLILGLVALVSFCVQLFSKSYLKDDPSIGRYYLYLHLFVGSMTLLLLTDSILIFYGAWELVGACSYLLISFWHQKTAAIQAAKKAFLINRLGDIALLFGLIALGLHFNTWQFSAMHGIAPALIGIAIIAGGMAKSAQFPLMSWLPDAMEGPTPASALIHAATMVAAGVFVGVRVFDITGPETHLFMGIIGAISFLAGAVFALFQNDIKKTLAYSTISQLGLMWMGMGSDASLFHLLTHGIFKAGLFLAAGAVIHTVHSQSLNDMGGLRKKAPVAALAYLVFGAGLMGLPLTGGFYSKESIAGYLYTSGHVELLVVLALGMVLTSFYISRQFYLIFMGPLKEGSSTKEFALPISILIIASLFIWISVNPLEMHENTLISIYHIPSFWLYITAATWVLGIAGAYVTRNWIPAGNYQFLPRFWPSLFRFIRWKSRSAQVFETQFIDRFVNGIAALQVIIAHLSAWFDRHIVDGILVGGSASLSAGTGRILSRWQSAKVQSYWAMIIVTFALFLLYALFIK
ncbi:NADH-quinone oxidoreductase subunit L [Aquirufa antheringensis]|jgi:NADH-quinone oxidoreductase subunit L|uniref:NADH-quinone oxidoreductase subunit M n=1 Tax=Aquirufa antheringensis TaxID=2516559 RepID=A0A4Q9BCF2_9BACT|nr:proton-conducting transporter membrane subunit [Aquirufa antheringensis]MCZ2485335.1 NADH-quinone oxidoreductase subunit M [Aquirufa antheringensis]MCZ2488268.1 NADH-quinone oxidoreductase subunit M [Aquirufa antheringensis]MCZ2490189.1 NADH-quinone oxidoreductase subunit M [Aquirufa antheringensis]TBH72178.1 NADH-quinone oxidoreductase subunit M [Aquirufa antheringensis]